MSDLNPNADAPLEPVLLPLEAYRVDSLPPNAYYIPSFLTPQESTTLLAHISSHPWTTLTHRRLQPHPAPLTPSGHLLTAKSLPEYLQTPIIDRLLSLSFTNPQDINNNDNNKKGIFTSSPHHRPNHVLINEYPPSTGISPHEDGSAYFPVVCTVSLGSHIVLEVTPKSQDHDTTNPGDTGVEVDEGKKKKKKYRIYQEPLSLLITTDEMYTGHLHGIEAVCVDKDLNEGTVANWGLLREETRRMIEEKGGEVRREEVRISLTYRDVLKVKDAGKVFGGKMFGKK